MQPGYELLTFKYFLYFKNSSLGPSKRIVWIVVLCFLSSCRFSLFLVCHTLGWPRNCPTLLLKATQSIDELFLLPGDLGKSWHRRYGDSSWQPQENMVAKNRGMNQYNQSPITMQDHCCNFQHKNTQIFDVCFIDLHGTLQPISRQRASSLEAEISSLRKMLCNESFSDSGFQEQTQELN